MKTDESLLLRQLKEGNSQAYRYIYEHHYKILCHIASQYLHDDYMAESVVGDVIFQLWRKREQIEIKTSLRRYLLFSVRNRCLDVLKSDAVNREQSLSQADGGSLDYIGSLADTEHPLGTLLENELEGMVRSAIESLPDDTRRVFELSRYENMKYTDIALQLGISVNTVKYHIKRALSLLQDKLGKYLVFALLFYPLC